MASKSGKMTPMMTQYTAMRRSLPDDVVLFFRLGDFYEMFFEDAQRAAPIMNVALTKRGGTPMCGVPFHAAEGYIGKLVKAGVRVAIAEQTSVPQPGKIVEREISQVISAGTVNDMNLLEDDRPNYLAAIFQQGRKFGLAFVDLTTGEFRVTEFGDPEALGDELSRIRPSELLVSEEQEEDFALVPSRQIYDGYAFLPDQAEYTLRDHFKVQSLDGFGCTGLTAAISAAGAVLHYLTNQMRRDIGHIRCLQSYSCNAHVLIDAASQANLELTMCRAGAKHTLLHALDRTKTPMGARKLRDWVLHPIRDLETLQARQNLIGGFVREPFVLSQTQDLLKSVRDIERIMGRLSQGSGNPRDMQSLGVSLREIPQLREFLDALGAGEEERGESGGGKNGNSKASASPLSPLPSLLPELLPRLRDFTELADNLDDALVEEPPVSVKDGGIFRDGFSAALDELRAASTEGKKWIADLQVREGERTGIKSLKVKYNAVFGYFIEITKSNLANVPDDYTRKQTTANAERFITPELKEMEDKILGADERIKQLELEKFSELREMILGFLDDIQDTAGALAEIDVIAGLAETARLFAYTQPLLNQSRNLHIEGGRHPVLDQNTVDEKFVPNDTVLEPDANRLLLITGPNMAGKSTYIRQVALITLMAQIGSWVPADNAEIGLVDRIFTRVGANDDLARGQSTFMVEMNETALIVNNATEDSLVILDEIGRGTSTFDGLSIAWSVAEYLHDQIGARTLFATHYHELTALANDRPGVKNYNVAVREWNDEIIFLRKIIAGTADRSYGIQVARLAGLPDGIIGRAKEILAGLESGTMHGEQCAAEALEALAAPDSKPKKRAKRKRAATPKVREGEEDESSQMSLFG